MNALRLVLARDGVTAASLGVALGVAGIDAEELAQKLESTSSAESPDPLDLAAVAEAPQLEKFDQHLGHDLLTVSYATSWIDAGTVPSITAELSRSVRRLAADA